MEPMHFHPAEQIAETVRREFARVRDRIDKALPRANVKHIGGTSIPGALTKGDLDLMVRVDAADFGSARTRLTGLYTIHQPENWTPTLASFKEEPQQVLPIGIQLVAVGSDDDVFHLIGEAIASDRRLLDAYNRLKAEHEGADPETYLDAKTEFMDGLAARLRRSSG